MLKRTIGFSILAAWTTGCLQSTKKDDRRTASAASAAATSPEAPAPTEAPGSGADALPVTLGGASPTVAPAPPGGASGADAGAAVTTGGPDVITVTFGGGSGSGPVPLPPDTTAYPTGPFSADEARAYLAEACAPCHERTHGSVAAQWPLDPAAAPNVTFAAAGGPAAYWAVKEKARGLAAGAPSPMPPTAATRADLARSARLAAYVEAELPATVAAAKATYERRAGDAGPTIILSYECHKRLTFRAFLARVTDDFFDRPPTASEAALGGAEPDHLLTDDDRRRLVARMFDAQGWLPEFETTTLRKFSSRLAGSAQLTRLPGLSDLQVADLREELYRLLLAKYRDVPYADILLGDDVQVSAATASLYGCVATGPGWQKCTLPAPRASYFTSVGFLLSKPSSFLLENNNYGRVKLLHFFISGDVFKSAADGPAGAAAPSPLPACLKTKDWRGTFSPDKTTVAPFGTAAIPASGSFCQGCHLARHLAAGSILFRPYTPAGLVYSHQTRIELDPAIDDATSEKRVNRVPGADGERVTAEMLTGWLENPAEQACAADQSGAGRDTLLPDVKALARLLIGDGAPLATGLARHLPRALSNQPQSTDEVVHAVSAALAGNGLLGKAFAAYLGSETYSCAAEAP